MYKLIPLLILSAFFYANALVIPQTPEKDVDGCFVIKTAEELYGFADEVNAGRTSDSTCAVLDADITVNKNLLDSEAVALASMDSLNTEVPGPECVKTGEACKYDVWIPIGNREVTAFKGRFDGRNHTIRGLFAYMPASDSVGFFGTTKWAVVENLNIADSYFHGNSVVGGIAGGFGGRMINSSFYGVIVSSGVSGGVVGILDGDILRSHNDGYVRGMSFVGGVVGNGRSSMINKCYNTGSVFGSENVAGIVGYRGNVIYSYNEGLVVGKKLAAGLMGKIFSSSDTLMYSFNTGRIYGGSDIVGGYTFSGEYTNILGNYSIKGARSGQRESPEILDSAVFASDSLLNVFNRRTFGLWKKGKGHPVFDENSVPELIDSVYQIKTAAQLLWFVDYINYAFAYPNTSAILLDDIVFNKNVVNSECLLKKDTCDFPEWTPIHGIRSLPDYYGFTGTFDGNGHSVSGLYMKSFVGTNYNNEGMFDRIDNRGVVKNLVLMDSYFNTEHLNIIAVYNNGKIIESFGKYYRDASKYSVSFEAEEYVVDFGSQGFATSYSSKNYVQKHENIEGLWFDGRRFAVAKRSVCYYKDSTECRVEGFMVQGTKIDGKFPRVLFPYRRLNPAPRFTYHYDAMSVTMDSLGYLAYKYRSLAGDKKEDQLNEVRLMDFVWPTFSSLDGVCLTYTSDHDMTLANSNCKIVLPKSNEPKTMDINFKDFELMKDGKNDTIDCLKDLRTIRTFYLAHMDSKDIEGVARIFELGPKGACMGGKKIAAAEPSFCYDAGVERDYCEDPDHPSLLVVPKTELPDAGIALTGKSLLFDGFAARSSYRILDLKGSVVKMGAVSPVVDVSSLHAGAYAVYVRDGAKSVIKKVVLK